MAGVISLRGICKRFEDGRSVRVVLDGLDLDLGRGELVAVVGRSGCGKSTLLHLIAGLEPADGGEIEVAGVRLSGLGEARLNDLRRNHVGFVFQFFHLLPELTGLENVLLPARLAGGGASARQRARRLLDELDMTGIAEHFPTVLSGGEQQRIAIARALINRPDVILADEPTGNLDASSGETVLRLLRSAADDGHGVLVVTHDPSATGLADRVLELRDGRLEPA